MKKVIMSVLTVWVLVNSMFIGLITFSDIENVQAPYIPHGPIRINSDAEFATMAGIEGWVGNGLPGNPYIIEGYDINGSGYGYCIYIGNTTVFFDIRESYLHEASGVGNFPYYPDSGIILYNVQNGTMADINASSNSFCGIYLDSSNINTITNNTASNNYRGLYLKSESNSNTIINTTALNNQFGIDFDYSNNNTITYNNASNNYFGIYLSFSNSNTIANNTANSNIEDGIHLYFSDGNNLTDNTVSNNNVGIIIESSSANTLSNNTMVENGIMIWGYLLQHWNTHTIDKSNNVNEKTVYYWKNQTGGTLPLDAGQVILANCTYMVVENLNLSNTTVGIQLGYSSNNTIANNTAYSNNWNGIRFAHSNSNLIINNTTPSNDNGIYLQYSSNNTITNNNISKNEYGISTQYSSHNTIANNNVSLNNNAGISITSSSNNNIITNNNILKNGYGIRLISSSSNTFINNTASNNFLSFYLSFSEDNTIANNTASSNTDGGVSLAFSSNNIITNNHASSNNNYGFRIHFSSINNNLTNNTASSNQLYGIYVKDSTANNIYHNNIINNTNQAYDNTINGNQWDNGYPSGGNYWSDYGGIDLNSTPSQNVPPPDSIGDTPYIIDSNSQDNYPLMNPIGNLTFLYEGWNLISVPFIQPYTKLDSVLSLIYGSYDAVQWFNVSDPSDPWKHHQISKPSYLNDLTDIDHIIGFWIHINEPGGVLFEYSGTQPTSNQSIPLHPGWNMVGYPSLTNRNRTAALNNLAFGVEVDAVWTFDAATQTWEEIGMGDYFEGGRGYWVHATQECVWEVGV